MNSMHSRSGFLAATLALFALAGCNAVEDVRSEPFIDLPPPTVALQGTVNGLGSRRSLVLTNNGLDSDSLTVFAPVPVQPSDVEGGIIPVSFNFGSRPVRDANGNPVPYNIEIDTVPYGKSCSFRAGTRSSGVLSVESPPHIVIDCVPASNLQLYDITVTLDPSFATSEGAKVRLTTEEAIYEQEVTPADVASGTITFHDKLFNASSNVANGPLAVPASPTGSPVFEWAVSASTTVGGTVNKCPVLRPSTPVVSGNLQNPSGNISGPGAPEVLACAFTISGAVSYSRPAEVTADPALGSGLTLELRDQSGVVRGTASVAGTTFPAAFTFTNMATPATTVFTSHPNADFQVVVTNHPAGQTCIVPDGGYVSLKSLVNLNPVSVTATGVLASNNQPPAAGPAATTNAPVPGTRLIVACRNRPAPADTLHGIYRLTKTVARRVSSVASGAVPTTVTSEWLPFDLTVQNTASSNIMTFFDDGTFLYGTHHNSVSVEHGFYEYSATLPASTAPGTPPGRLRFTLHTDTYFNTVFPTGFSSAEQVFIGNGTVTPGVSALPGALTYTTAPNAPLPFRHANLGDVVKTAATGSQPARITGTSGPYGGVAASISSGAFTFNGPIAPTTATTTQQVDWELTEVASADGEFTGGWMSRDHRRIWTWDKASNYGIAVGVNGLTNIESACFVNENPVSPSGTYQRRGAITSCYPINRPRAGQAYFSFGTEAVDTAVLLTTHNASTTVGVPAVASGSYATGNVVPGSYSTAQLAARFPNYEARIPGGQTALDGRSPSPVHYFVAPAATFATSAPPQYFPAPAAPFTSWCNSDIMGIRATLNGVPYQEPVYLCRTRAQ